MSEYWRTPSEPASPAERAQAKLDAQQQGE
jgi:hypothetical protein